MTRFGFAALLLGATGLSIGACRAPEGEQEVPGLTRAALDARVRFLAADVLQGRAPGSTGAEIAADFIANQFELAGLRAAAGDSSYSQTLELITATQAMDLTFRAPGGAALSPEPGAQAVGWTGDTASAGGTSGELVFAGYGISAPDLGRDDFKSLNVTGKVLLVLPGAPPSYAEAFSEGGGPGPGVHWSEKVEEASRRGAAGVIFAHSSQWAGYSWEAVRAIASAPRMSLADDPAFSASGLVAWLDLETVEGLVAMAGIDLETMLQMAAAPEFQPVGTGVIVSANYRSQLRRVRGSNVAGFLPGSDPELAQEFVVFTAHYDQLGSGPARDGDSIYNGAYDNASGTGLLLGLAEAFAQLQQAPRRSLLFLATTAGATGPLGASAYLRDPLIPLSRTVAVINLDGVNLWGPTRDIVVWDAEHSTLDRLAVAAAIAEGLEPRAGARPGELIFYRSDHEQFARAGVPAVRVGHGLNFVGHLPEWGRQQLQDYVDRHYLRPSDEVPDDLDLRGALQQGRVAFRLGLQAANGDARPAWKQNRPAPGGRGPDVGTSRN